MRSTRHRTRHERQPPTDQDDGRPHRSDLRGTRGRCVLLPALLAALLAAASVVGAAYSLAAATTSHRSGVRAVERLRRARFEEERAARRTTGTPRSVRASRGLCGVKPALWRDHRADDADALHRLDEVAVMVMSSAGGRGGWWYPKSETDGMSRCGRAWCAGRRPTSSRPPDYLPPPAASDATLSLAASRDGNNRTNHYCERGVAALQTWGESFSNLLYVFDGPSQQLLDAEPTCAASSPRADLPGSAKGATMYRCAGHAPIVVFPQCTVDYWGPRGPCCKAEAALVYAAAVLLRGDGDGLPGTVKWVAFGDDDMYVGCCCCGLLLYHCNKRILTSPTS